MIIDRNATGPLDIALLAPLVSPIREPFLGGSQAVARDLAVALAARGHTVTLYAAQGSDQAALPGVTLMQIAVDAERVRPTNFAANRPDQPLAALDAAVEQAFQRAFDAIAAHEPHHQLMHAHAYDEPAFRLAQRLPLPTAHTLHMDAIVPEINATLARLSPAHRDRAPQQPWLATVSRSCAASYAAICRIDAVIYNGLDLDAIPFAPAPAPDAHALYAGRIAPEKGVEDAILIALAANMPLTLVGGVYDQAYHAARIQPLLDAHPDRLSWLGPLPREKVWRHMGAATVALVPSLWDEPFGLVACEALAAGVPVVGYDSGALREIVEQGVTGALVLRGAIAEAAASIPTTARFDRAACRQRIAARFSLAAFVAGHERLYRQMLANG
ncbi:MAG: glycosyltransferase [Ktedonobacterales bacterium]